MTVALNVPVSVFLKPKLTILGDAVKRRGDDLDELLKLLRSEVPDVIKTACSCIQPPGLPL